MKKNVWLFLLFLLIGLISGTLASRSLASVSGLSFLTNTSKIEWSPAADFIAISYDITLRIDISLLSIIGVILAVWMYRKL